MWAYDELIYLSKIGDLVVFNFHEEKPLCNSKEERSVDKDQIMQGSSCFVSDFGIERLASELPMRSRKPRIKSDLSKLPVAGLISDFESQFES